MPQRMNPKQERAAWTEYFTGQPQPKESKYKNVRTGGYHSAKEAEYATRLHALDKAGHIKNLKEQDWIVLLEGRKKTATRPAIRGVSYVADFTYYDLEDNWHVIDAKGKRTEAYSIKKRLAALLLNIYIEEV